jgi:hypothetical protein
LGQWIGRGFDEEEDFGDFIVLMLEVNHKAPLRVIGYCLMTNHFHLVLWPKKQTSNEWIPRASHWAELFRPFWGL